jgi:hypothetical protein
MSDTLDAHTRALLAAFDALPDVLEAPKPVPDVRKLTPIAPVAPGDTVGIHAKGAHKAATVELIQRACELRRAGLPYREIAGLMGLSVARAHQLVETAKRERVMEASELIVAYELEQLETLRAKALEIMERYAPLVMAGGVITDTIDNPETGLPTIDHRTGKELRVRLQDSGPALAAMDRLIKISEQIRKLKGIDAPKRTEVTAKNDPSASPLAGLTPEQLQACITEGVRQLHGVRTGPVIDVECVEVPNGNA